MADHGSPAPVNLEGKMSAAVPCKRLKTRRKELAPCKRLETRRKELMTKKPYAITICLLGLAAQLAVSASAAAQSTQAAEGQPPLMDRQKEIALALSACPPSVASQAAVYVLDKSGYVKARDSTARTASRP